MNTQATVLDADLEEIGVEPILQFLAMSQKSGVLIVTAPGIQTRLYLRQGKLVMVVEEAGDRPDFLDLLVLSGSVTEQDAAAIRSQVAQRPEATLALLKANKSLPLAELRHQFAFQSVQALYRLLKLKQGHLSFQLPGAAEELDGLALDIDRLLLESLRLVDEGEGTPRR